MYYFFDLDFFLSYSYCHICVIINILFKKIKLNQKVMCMFTLGDLTLGELASLNFK